MSFAEPSDVMAILEECYTAVFERFALKPLNKKPWPRITYDEAMRRFGSDRPDTRFAMELVDLTDLFRGSAFAVFRDAIDGGGSVRGIVVPGKADASRKEVDAWTAVAKTKGAKGLVSFAFKGSEVSSPVAKFLSADELSRLRGAALAKEGDMLLAVAADHHTASVSIGTLRSHIGSQLAIADASKHHFLWVHPFPMFERTPEGGWTFSHNPFSGPLSEADVRLLETDPGKALSTQYDMVVDGNELGGGSIRIHNRVLQERVFELMGISKAEAATRFGALLDALEYGAPPEGGIATGMDRTVMILAGLPNARETIAFPKTQTGYDPLLDAPADLDDKLLEELGLRVVRKPEKS